MVIDLLSLQPGMTLCNVVISWRLLHRNANVRHCPLTAIYMVLEFGYHEVVVSVLSAAVVVAAILVSNGSSVPFHVAVAVALEILAFRAHLASASPHHLHSDCCAPPFSFAAASAFPLAVSATLAAIFRFPLNPDFQALAFLT